MDMKAMFPNLNIMWVRWSSYEVADWHGVRYLMPSPGAEPLTYNCAEQVETLVADAVELGRQIAEGTAELDRVCAAFAARHGLLGLETGKDAGLFSKGDVAPVYRSVNDKEYGEEPERFKAEMVALYQHFLSTRGEAVVIDTIPAITGGLSYKLTSGQTPQLIWETDSLQCVLRLAYAAIITSPGTALKVCKNCGMVYHNPHAKSEFCSTKCRNYYNVKAFRERQQ